MVGYKIEILFIARLSEQKNCCKLKKEGGIKGRGFCPYIIVVRQLDRGMAWSV